jgi:phage-related protein
MNYVGPIANSMGMSIEKTTAALSTLYNAGLKGEQAGTGLRSVLSDLANPTKAATSALEAMGISIADVNPATHELTDIIQLLADKGLDSTEAFKIFGQVGAPAILSLTSHVGDLKNLTTELGNAGGAAQTLADEQLNTLSGSLEALKGSIENLFINVGQALSPTVRQIATTLDEMMPSIQNWVVGIVETFVSFVDKLKPSIGYIVTIGETVAGAFADIFGAVTGSGANAVSGVANIINSIFNRVAGIVLEVTPIVKAGIITIIETVKSIIAGLQPTWTNIKIIVAGIIAVFQSFFSGLSNVSSGDVAGGITGTINSISNVLASLSITVTNALVSIAPMIKSIFSTIVNTIKTLIPKLKTAWGSISQVFSNIDISAIIANLQETWDKIKEKFGELSGIISGIVTALKPVWNVIKSLFDAGVEIFKSFVDNLGPAWDNLRAAWDSTKIIWEQFSTTISPAISGLLEALGGSKSGQAVTIGSALAGVINIISGAVAGLLKFVADHPIITKAVVAIVALAAGLALIGTAAAALVVAVSAGLAALPAVLTGIFTAAVGAITNFAIAVGLGFAAVLAGMVIDKIIDGVYELKAGLEGAWAGINTAVSNVKTWWTQFWTDLKTRLSEDAKKINDYFHQLNIDIGNAFTNIKTTGSNFYNDWVTRWNTIKQYVIDSATNIKNALQSWVTDLGTKFGNVKTAVTNLYNDWKKVWDNIVNTITTKKTEILNQIQLAVNGVWDKAKQFYNAGASIITNLKNGVESKIQGVKDSINGLLTWIDRNMPHSPALEGPLSRLPNFAGYITAPLQSAVKTATSTAKSAGSSIISSISAGIKSAASSVYNAAASALSKVSNLLPHSPAKEGPFKKLPDWDAIFLTPMMKSISQVNKLSLPLTNALSNVRSPLDSGMTSGMRSISNINNSSSNINYEGSSFTVGPNYVQDKSDINTIIYAVKASIADDRRRKGIGL